MGKYVLPGRSAMPLSRVVLPLFGLAIFLQAYRVPVHVIAPGLDASYPHVLNLFAFSPLRFGSELIYTYGPLGFLLFIENVGNNLIIGFAFWTLAYLLFSFCLVCFVTLLTEGWMRIVTALLSVLVAHMVDTERLLLFIVLLLLFIAHERADLRVRILALCGGLAAVAFLIRFPMGVACAGALAGGVLPPLRGRLVWQRLSITAGSAALSFCLVWLLLYGSLSGVADYFVTSFELSRGYTAVMAVTRPGEDTALVLFGIVLASLAMMIVLLPTRRRVYAMLVLIVPLFVAWKHGVVRFDLHIAGFVRVCLFVAFLLLVLYGASMRVFRVRRLLSVLCVMAIVPLLDRALEVSGIFGSIQHPLFAQSPVRNLRWEGSLIGWGGDALKEIKDVLRWRRFKARLDAVASRELAGHRLDRSVLDLAGNGTIDIYSYELGFVAANPQLNYQPKPIFQHFNAFTPRLDAINAEYFRSARKPQLLLMHHPGAHMSGVDGRHILFDDPITFPEVLNSYRPVYVERNPMKPPVALLKRTAEARFSAPCVFKEEVVRWNQTIRIPDDDASAILRVKVKPQRSLVAFAKEAAFRLSPMYLVYVLSDQSEERFRLVPTHMESGVWVTPLFVNYWNFYDFLKGDPWFGPGVVAIRFEADNPGDYSESFELAWERIKCKDAYCQPLARTVYNSRDGGAASSPALLTAPFTSSFDSPVDSLMAIDVFLSTYGQLNKGSINLDVLNDVGATIGSSTVRADAVFDNQYQLFRFTGLSNMKGRTLQLRLSYDASGAEDRIAAWRPAGAVSSFDFRVYGR